jgi:hypothetical protein
MNNYIQQTINDRIYSRNVPSADLEPYLSDRPLNTKYVNLNDINTRQKQLTIQKSQHTVGHEYNTYNINTVFSPGNSSGPWSGFSSNIDTESILRDQEHRIPCKPTYLPNYKTSDLYTIRGPYSPQNIKEFPYLPASINQPNELKSKEENIQKIPSNTFNTHTRLLR